MATDISPTVAAALAAAPLTGKICVAPGKDITAADAAAIADCLAAHPDKITEFSVRNSDVARDAFPALIRGLDATRVLERLDMCSGSIAMHMGEVAARPAAAVAAALRGSGATLKFVSLDRIYCFPQSAAPLVVALAAANATNPALALEEVELGMTGLDANSAVAIVRALSALRRIKRLDLRSNSVDDDAAVEIAHVLAGHPSLQELVLTGNDLSHVGMEALIEGLGVNNPVLHSLNLAGNECGDFGAVAVAQGLMHPDSTLRDLDMSANYIGETGMASLTEAVIANNGTLCTLKLGGNQLVGVSFAQLLDSLAHNCPPRLSTLRMDGTRLSDTGTAMISSMLMSNTTLTTLGISDCGITDDVSFCLEECLPRNSTLRELDLAYNCLSAEGVLDIANSLNATLETVRLTGVKIDAAARQRIDAALRGKSLPVRGACLSFNAAQRITILHGHHNSPECRLARIPHDVLRRILTEYRVQDGFRVVAEAPELMIKTTNLW
jgi:hypothetical protein